MHNVNQVPKVARSKHSSFRSSLDIFKDKQIPIYRCVPPFFGKPFSKIGVYFSKYLFTSKS